MIRSKEDYLYYCECDKVALKYDNQTKPLPFKDLIWRYELLLRKLEYVTNCHKGNAISRLIIQYRFKKLALKLGYSINLNTCGPGLSIAHYGTIIINREARIGANCRIHAGVTLGATNGSNKAPIVGNNVFLGEGCKLIGDIRIADGVQIGANAVVVKSITELNTTWGGIPAKRISNNSSASNLVMATEFVDKNRFFISKVLPDKRRKRKMVQ